MNGLAMANENNNLNNLALIVGRACVYDEKKETLWLITSKGSFLLEVSLSEQRVREYYSLLPAKSVMEYGYISMIKLGEKLIMTPYTADEMIIFDEVTHIIEHIALPLRDEEMKVKKKFQDIVSVGKNIYLIGSNLGIIIKYDIDKKSWDRIYDEENSKGLSIANCIKQKNSILIPLKNEVSYLLLNCETEQLEKVVIDGNKKAGITAFELAGTVLIVACDDGSIICQTEDKRIHYKKVSDDYIYRIVAGYDKDLYVFNLFTGKILRVCDYKQIEALEFELPKSNDFDDDNYSKFEFVIKNTNDILFQSRATGDIYALDMIKREIHMLNIEISTILRDSLIAKVLAGTEIVREGKAIDLIDFIRFA